MAGFLTPVYCTSAGTLNFSTTPSSKKQRIPHLMSSNSDKGKSLKRNSSNSTVLESGMVVFCTLETRRKRSACHPEQPELMRSIAACTSQCLPTACTSPSGHSLLVQSQTFLECSVRTFNESLSTNLLSVRLKWYQSTGAKAYQNGLYVIQRGLCLVHEHFLGNIFPPLCPVQFVVCAAVQGRPAKELG